MNTLWFLILGGMLVVFAILDGANLGVGAMHLVLGKTDNERRTQLGSIGPVWFGYEVWLIAAGGSMVSAFPDLYAKSFSGFYLVLTLVLWLMLIRGSSIEFRHQLHDGMWSGFWDVCYCASSALLAVLFGAAVGNVVRGVPFNSTGNFIGSFSLALNPYAVLVGVLSLVYLAMHGSIYTAVKTGIDEHRKRAFKWASGLFAVAIVLMVGVTLASLLIRPDLLDNFHRFPILCLLPIVTLAGIVALALSLNARKPSRAFAASAATLAGLMGSAGASLYPNLLPNLGCKTGGLTIYNSAAPHTSLALTAAINLVGLSAVLVYGLYVHKVFAGKVVVSDESHAY